MDYIKILQEEKGKVKKVLRNFRNSSTNVELFPDRNELADAPKSSSVKPHNKREVCASNNFPLVYPEFTASLATWSPELSLESSTITENVYYIANVLPERIAVQLLELIEVAGNQGGWIPLKSRRLQHWGHKPQQLENNYMPNWLIELIQKLCDLKLFPGNMKPNNVLINQYESDQGILHHTDGPLYRDYVFILSLDSDCIMTFKPNLKSSEIGSKPSDDVFSVVLEARSFFIFSGDKYSQMMHGIYDHEETSVVGEGTTCLNATRTAYNIGDQVCSLY